jgi:ABC-type transport system involved in Fe-S cluster assembly fused permease/ATPase subunit
MIEEEKKELMIFSNNKIQEVVDSTVFIILTISLEILVEVVVTIRNLKQYYLQIVMCLILK